MDWCVARALPLAHGRAAHRRPPPLGRRRQIGRCRRRRPRSRPHTPCTPLSSRPPAMQAIAAAATMAQQLLVWLLAVLAPGLFDRLRPVLYTLSATIPTVRGLPFPLQLPARCAAALLRCPAALLPVALALCRGQRGQRRPARMSRGVRDEERTSLVLPPIIPHAPLPDAPPAAAAAVVTAVQPRPERGWVQHPRRRRAVGLPAAVVWRALAPGARRPLPSDCQPGACGARGELRCSAVAVRCSAVAMRCSVCNECVLLLLEGCPDARLDACLGHLMHAWIERCAAAPSPRAVPPPGSPASPRPCCCCAHAGRHGAAARQQPAAVHDGAEAVPRRRAAAGARRVCAAAAQRLLR